ncbi:MAG: DUF4129 domain-containing protein [Candidatus Schekmanbacteria bacterium]|nr:DUF4129 domain-containing protein [Candidatus Schekmanbacteria bacterium]
MGHRRGARTLCAVAHFLVLLGVGARARGATPVVLTPESVDAAVEAVFSDPTYPVDAFSRRARGSDELVRRIFETLSGWFNSFTNFVQEVHAAAPTLYWALTTVLLIVLIALIAHIAWTVREAFRGMQYRTPVAESGSQPRERLQSCDELRRQAKQSAARGALEEGGHLLLLALLALIEEARVLDVAAGTTTREVVARLQDRREYPPDVASFARVVERAWYGAGRVSQGEFDSFEVLLGRIAEGYRGTEVMAAAEAMAVRR